MLTSLSVRLFDVEILKCSSHTDCLWPIRVIRPSERDDGKYVLYDLFLVEQKLVKSKQGNRVNENETILQRIYCSNTSDKSQFSKHSS